MVRYLFLFFLISYCIFTITLDAIGAQEGSEVEQKMIHAEIRLKGCAAEMYVNGIPLTKIEAPPQSFISMPVPQYLLDGTNLLELVVNPGPTPSQARTPQGKKPAKGMSAEVRLVRYPVGVFTGDLSGEILAKAEWSGKDDEEAFPILLSTSCDLGAQFGRWAWQDATKITLNDATRVEILTVVRNVYNAYQSGKADFILNLDRIRITEAAQAYPGSDIAQDNQLFSRDLTANIANPNWQMLPFDEAQFDFRLAAQGRLVECIRKDWNQIVAGKIKEDILDYPMFLAKIKGQWQIVR
jgi:hypothetical protein